MIATPNPEKRQRLKSTLIVIILATIPCYLLGLVIVWVGNSIKARTTPTPVITSANVTITPEYASPTLPQPSAIFDTSTPTPTETVGPSPTPSATYFIPSSTPTLTPTPTYTPTVTFTVTATPSPSDTATATMEFPAPPQN